MARIDTEILIAGGGVAGLAAAAAFAAEGFDVICVDPAPPVTSAEAEGADLRSTAFLTPSVEVLRRAGLWDRMAPMAAALRVMRLAEAGGPEAGIRETADFSAAELGIAAFGYNLPNWLLRREMAAHLEALPNARLLHGEAVRHLTTRLSGAIVRLSGGTSLGARLVVAADGRDSAVRAALGIGVRRWSYGQKANVFSVAHPLPHDGVSTEIHRSGGPFTLVPLPDRDGVHLSAVIWMETGPRAQALADMPEPAFAVELNLRSCGVLGDLRLVSARRLWPIIGQVADRMDGPRVALVAEAAHVIPPIGAQGLNMSLRDIASLRDLVVGARDADADFGAPKLLTRYSRARRPDILARIAGVDALNRAARTDVQALRDLRRFGLRALSGIAPARRAAMALGLGAGRAADAPARGPASPGHSGAAASDA